MFRQVAKMSHVSLWNSAGSHLFILSFCMCLTALVTRMLMPSPGPKFIFFVEMRTLPVLGYIRLKNKQTKEKRTKILMRIWGEGDKVVVKKSQLISQRDA